MKPLGLFILIMPIAIVIAGFVVANYAKSRTAVDISTKLFLAIMSIDIGTVTGLVVFIPVYLLFCTIFPNVSHNGHVVMPIGQVFWGSITSLIIGIVSTTIAYTKILRWQIRKYGILKPTDSYRVKDDKPQKNY